VNLQSIRVRLTAWYTAVVAVVLIAMAFGMYTLAGRVLERRSDAALMEISNTVLSATGDRPSRLTETIRRYRAPDRRLLLMTREGQLLAESEPALFREFVDHRVFSIQPTDDRLRAIVRELPERRGLPRMRRDRERGAREPVLMPEAGSPGPMTLLGGEGRGQRFRGVEIADGESPVRALARPLPPGYPRDYVLVMLGSAREQSFILDMLRNALGLTTLFALVLAAAPGYFLARRSLAPVSAMSKRAAKIGAQNLDERLPVANPHDELGELSRVLNDLLDRLQRAFEQQRRFMAEAAHELRTPVAIVRAESELALSKSQRSPQQYREALGIVESESLRMSRIVDDLLTLSRAEAGEYPLRRMPIDLADIIARTARSLRVKADQRNVAIDVQTDALPPMEGDADLIQRMLTNLIDNAIRHAHAGTEVIVEARGPAPDARAPAHNAQGPNLEMSRLNGVTIRVINTGVAIDAETQARIFEPFFRGEAARAGSDAEGGAGLGLPIAQWIARAHGGELRLVQATGNPTSFEVVLPTS